MVGPRAFPSSPGSKYGDPVGSPMVACEIRTAVRHAIPGGFFSRPELSDVDMVCPRPAEWRVTVRGLDHGNHREEAQAIALDLCAHHLAAFRQLDDRLHAVGWSHALHGPALPADPSGAAVP